PSGSLNSSALMAPPTDWHDCLSAGEITRKYRAYCAECRLLALGDGAFQLADRLLFQALLNSPRAEQGLGNRHRLSEHGSAQFIPTLLMLCDTQRLVKKSSHPAVVDELSRPAAHVRVVFDQGPGGWHEGQQVGPAERHAA